MILLLALVGLVEKGEDTLRRHMLKGLNRSIIFFMILLLAFVGPVEKGVAGPSRSFEIGLAGAENPLTTQQQVQGMAFSLNPVIHVEQGEQSCTDSDGGLNYEVAGYVEGIDSNGWPYTKYDVCETGPNEGRLKEFYCNGTMPWPKFYQCPYGCTGGACLPQSSECTDSDGDGFAIEGGDCGPVDCNDSNPSVYPPEDCDLALGGSVDTGVAGPDQLVEMGVAGPGLVISLADADLTLVGEDDGDWAAYFASPAGDVNHDGHGDVLVGAPMAGNKVCPVPEDPCPPPYIAKGEGVGYLVLGLPQGEWLPNPVNLAHADASFLGCEVESMTARQLYTAGDVNGDDYDDILISGWKCGPKFTGKAYLFLGRPDVDSWGRHFPVEGADASFLGENEWDFLSYYVSTAGDVNADGYDDFLITSTHYDISNTQVMTDPGKVYLILGRQAADWGTDYPVALADASFLGEAEGDRLGRAATGVGDVNGDGYDDFLIASIRNDFGGESAGQSYLFLGRAREGDPDYDPTRPWWGSHYSAAGADASFVGEGEWQDSGRRVAWAGDVNGDGYSDFLIGAALNDYVAENAGIAYLILGRPEADWGMRYPLAEADASFVGEEKLDQAGRRLNGAGDVNNDGYADFLIGAPHNQRGSGVEGIIAGTAYLIYGRPAADWGRYFSLSQADIIYVGKPDVGVAGYDVAWLGDFDGDSIDDFLIGAYGGRNNNEVPGEAYVLLGGDAPVPLQFAPDAPEGVVGEWHSFTGDYWEPNGWQDLNKVQLVLGRDEYDPKGLRVSYEPADDALYLRNSVESGWLGPCSPGETVKLNNDVVQLDCGKSTVDPGPSGRLRVMWHARWLRPFGASAELSAYLRARDLSGHDSGFVEFGTWPLWWHDLALTKTVAPSAWVSAGAPLTYTLTFSNAGGITATNVLITDVVPSEMINVSIDSNRPITRTGTIDYTWLVDDLPPAQGGVITLTGTVEPALPLGYTFPNTATISGNAPGSELRPSSTSSVMVIVPFRTYLPLVRK